VALAKPGGQDQDFFQNSLGPASAEAAARQAAAIKPRV
jgi:hypothetical protein